MQELEGIMPILSLVVTVIMALFTQIWRNRRQIGIAKNDPINFALKTMVETFTFQDESLYLMSLLSKLMKNLIKYLTLLASNGEDVLIKEIQSITQSLALDIARLEAYTSEEKLTDDQRQILNEVKSLLLRRE
jgi:hypothetical protein